MSGRRRRVSPSGRHALRPARLARTTAAVQRAHRLRLRPQDQRHPEGNRSSTRRASASTGTPRVTPQSAPWRSRPLRRHAAVRLARELVSELGQRHRLRVAELQHQRQHGPRVRPLPSTSRRSPPAVTARRHQPIGRRTCSPRTSSSRSRCVRRSPSTASCPGTSSGPSRGCTRVRSTS